ncbi:MAG TPA: PilC/PilY family type IV pilus protein [Steroidobacteraceae bacterium]|nr:PilC/PilY family type IV pilus protein [Steroidobacteraceae bacterium]
MSSITPAMRSKIAAMLGTAVSVMLAAGNAQALNIADAPLFLTQAAEPLVMLTMSNDEQLYHKAYTDFDDVDGDGLIDTTYKDTFNYTGYFDAKKCYSYSGAVDSGQFNPTNGAGGANEHDCDTVSGGGRWSGNFLNWASMTRMDVMRRVFYGGYRSTDQAASTVLERVYLPSDNHAWTKLFDSDTLPRYTPYARADFPAGITMCNVTPKGSSTDVSQTNTTSPRLRIAKGAWTEWAAQEVRQCLWTSEFTPVDTGASPNDATTDKADEFTVRVKACDSSQIGTEPCKSYGTTPSWKPIGLLQDYADADKLAIRFGLMTGSYGKRKSGGVLRKNVARLTDEISATDGTFTNVDGIIKSINLMRISKYEYALPTGTVGYGNGAGDNCPFGQNSWNNGACSNWGNPLGEMYLETLRYFSNPGGASPLTPNFSSNDTGWIANLQSATWKNPYSTTLQAGGKAPHCAKPNVIAISTGVLSFDNDDYGGASNVTGLNVNSETDAVGLSEGVNGKNWYVGSLTGGSPNDVCTSRQVNNLSAVTGICPESAGLQGSFKIAGLAAFAHKSTTHLQTVGGKQIQPVDTYTVALAPPIPSIKVRVGASNVTIIPVGYQTRNNNAMSLVNFRVIDQKADGSEGTFFMNYENAPAGSDYDNDEKGFLRYIVSGDTIKIIMHQSGSSSGANQKMGYIIDGVTDAGTHYLVANNNINATDNTGAGGTWPTQSIATIDGRCAGAGFAADPAAATVTDELCHYTNVVTGQANDRYMRGIKTHTAGTPATGSLKSPLWYAAKYGGFKDINTDGVPQALEWDADGDGDPDTYFPVTDAGQLGVQLKRAFNEIIERTASASSASVNSGSISNESRVYQAVFNSRGWTGDLRAFEINASDGSLIGMPDNPEWSASDKMPAHGLRSIFTLDSTGNGIPFTWASVSTDTARVAQLDPATGNALAQPILDYLRGDASNEQGSGTGAFRKRLSKLGDIVSSSPLFVAAPPFRYRDTLEGTSADASYFKFRDDNAGRTKVVYAGANDGMLHAFNAENTPPAGDEGKEMFAYVPGAVFKNLRLLSSPAYTHRYFVDGAPNMGDAFFNGHWHTVLVGGLNKGGQGIYALDITKPSTFDESNVLWEFNDVGAGTPGDTGDSDLGMTYSRPAIVRLNTGKWAAVFGNGYNNSDTTNDTSASTTGRAALYIVDIEDGKLIRKISVPGGTTAVANGLATPAAVDFNGDVNVDYVFAGDLLGNMWKFDLTDTNASNWKVAYTDGSGNPKPLYVAKDDSNNIQPITSRPEVGRGPNGNGMVVLFGTGKFLEDPTDKDLSTRFEQSFYGVYDPNTGAASDAFTGRGSLVEQTIDSESTVSGLTLRVTSNNAPGARGWYMDFVSPGNQWIGERVVSNPLLRNGRVIFTTLIPDVDPCGFGGHSWLMELDSVTGKRLAEAPFDLNRDGKFDANDFVPGTPPRAPSGMYSGEVGITPEPGVLTDPLHGVEYKYTPGTSGQIQVVGENPGAGNVGRQSWRQIR